MPKEIRYCADCRHAKKVSPFGQFVRMFPACSCPLFWTEYECTAGRLLTVIENKAATCEDFEPKPMPPKKLNFWKRLLLGQQSTEK